MNCASASLFGSEPLLSMNCATKLLIHRFSARFDWSIQYDYTYRRAQIQWIICIEGSPNLQCTLGCQRFCNPNIPEFKMMKYGKTGLMLQQAIKVESIRNVGQRLRKEIRRFWKTICRLLGWITSLQWLKTHICTMVKTNSLKKSMLSWAANRLSHLIVTYLFVPPMHGFICAFLSKLVVWLPGGQKRSRFCSFPSLSLAEWSERWAVLRFFCLVT